MKRSEIARKMPLRSQASIARTTELKGGGELKRTRLKPVSKKAVEASRTASAARVAWARAGDHPERCAGCERVLRCHGHHALKRQYCRKYGGDEWSLANRIPICATCHDGHHHGLEDRRLPLSILTEVHWEFARELLGERAEEVLARHYRPA